MLNFIDIHTHNANTANNCAVVNLSPIDTSQILNTSEHRFFSCGIHPYSVDKINIEQVGLLEKAAYHQKIVAIGECGLDRNAKASFKEQMYYFERQIHISELTNKPLIIHSVASHSEIIHIKKRINPSQNWIIHGFRGKPQLAEQFLKHDFNLSFGEFFNKESVEICPIERLCLETDESNLPIEAIYKQISAIKNCEPQALHNACQWLKMYIC